MALAAASNLLASLIAAGGRGASPTGRKIGSPQQGRGVGQQPQRHYPGHLAWGGQQFSSLPAWMAWVTAHGGDPQQVLATHPGIGATFGQRGVTQGGGITSGDGFGVHAGGLGGMPGPPTPPGPPRPGLLGVPPQVPPFQPPSLIGPPMAGPTHGVFPGEGAQGPGYPTSGLLSGLRQAGPVRRRPPRSLLGQGRGVSPFGGGY